MTLVPMSEFDIVFISYDEPNADHNWQDLLDKCPWAKRSHGVYGSDAAHKAAAKLSETSRFFTVDADNIVSPDFFNIEFDMEQVGKDAVLSWASKNEVNGLAYGNGGIKFWPKHVVNRMRTHEAAPENKKSSQVDFCWDINYVQMNNVYSRTYNNASPLQAWRAGFREGCKMTLEGGDTVARERIKKVFRTNFQRLLVWQSVGADTLNGLWAIYGARLGTVMTNLRNNEWDWRNVRDFEWLNDYWHNTVAPQFAAMTNGELNEFVTRCEATGYQYYEEHLRNAIRDLGQELRDELDFDIADLDAQGSKFFKAAYSNPARVHPLASEKVVIRDVYDDVTETILEFSEE